LGLLAGRSVEEGRTKMKRLVIVALMFALFASARKHPRDWKRGKISDAAMHSTQYSRGSTTTATTRGTVSPDYGGGSTVQADTDATTVARRMEVDTVTVSVVGDEYIYTAQSSLTHSATPMMTAYMHRKRVCRFIAGSEANYVQEKGTLYVVDADGKECTFQIVRQEKRQ
jgi:hypothetical protein